MINDVVLPPSDIWAFRRETDGWRWRRTSVAGEEVAHSRTAFQDMEKCVEDASLHGYAVTADASSSMHGLVGSLSSRTAKSFRTVSEMHGDIERDGVADDDEAEPDYPDGERP